VAGRGRGVVAGAKIDAGETALVFRGPLISLEQIEDFTHVIEIAPGRFLGPSGGPDDLVNHSCDPNCELCVDGGSARLRTLRPIEAGEELTYDYSTGMLTDPTVFDCACGSERCRGVVRRWVELPRAVRERQLERRMVPAFVAGADGSHGR
jgi:hypothetical protein